MKVQKTISILGSGWLGLPLADYLVNSGYSVKCSTTSKSKIEKLKTFSLQPFLIDIENIDDNISKFLDSEILVINITSKNINAFKELALKIEQSPINKVILVSSTSVYENSENPITEENGKIVSGNKLSQIEEILKSSTVFKTTILRFAGLIGYSRNPGRFFKNGREITNPKGVVNLIHRDDCIEIINQVIANNSWGEIYNCCADSHPTREEFYTYASISAGEELPKFGNSSEKVGKLIRNDKLKMRLRYQFKFPDLMKMDFSK